MANRPQGTAWNRRLGGPSASASSGGDRNWESVEQLVLDLENPDLRENALIILSKERGAFPDLATLLWSSFGAVVALLQEIVSIYPHLSSPNLTAVASNRVCNAIALLQCMASHPKNRVLFLNAHMPLYLYPFLNTITKTRPFEYLRVSSLGVIAALLKVNDGKAIDFLLSTEIIPLCLQSMEMGTELSKTVSTVIIQKILLDDVGLRKICATAQRFFAVHRMLGSMISSPTEQPSSRLLKYIIRCYLRLSDNPRASEVLKNCLPEMLKEAAVRQVFHDDPTAMLTLEQLLYNLSGTRHVVI